MSPVKINENNIFAVLTIGSSVLLALLTVCGLIFISASFAIGVVAGGVAAIANSHWLYRTLQRAMGLPAPQAVRFAQVRYALRLTILAIIVSTLIIYVKINIYGLLLGLSVLVITIIAVTVYLATLNGG
ncbi:MAG: ATP synthase subunit I [Deltaproteobacteria bacterium]|nr:ATP synthase subunit I [Deltaproteobacteria bacterium]